MAETALDGLGGWGGVLARLLRGDNLESSETSAVLGEILAGNATPAQVAGLLIALRAKGETVGEIAGLVQAMLANAEKVDVAGDILDTCGTGGDRSGTFNVSTASALVAAGAGARVCKHGGRASSSLTGSADVLAELGVAIELGPAGVKRCIEETGIGFCFAQRFHPAMRYVNPVRRELAVGTVFNFMGPLANPARALFQVVGVGDPAMAEVMIGVLAENGSRRAMVVHGADGLDEISTTGPSTVYELQRGADGKEPKITKYTIDSVDLGLDRAELDDLRGGDAVANASIIKSILAGERGAPRDVVLLNSSAALVVAGIAVDLTEGITKAEKSLDEGNAYLALERLVEVSQQEMSKE